MINIVDLEKNIIKYVNKNLPAGLPVVKNYIGAYIKSLLTSDSVVGLLNDLDAVTIGCSGVDVDIEDSFLPWESADHFILKDYCGFVGVVYKKEYREAIVRSFVRKDFDFCKWLFGTYFGDFVKSIDEVKGADEGSSLTDMPSLDNPLTTDYNENRGGVLVTDVMVYNLPAVRVCFDIDDYDEVNKLFIEYYDLFWLVLPARLIIYFRFEQIEQGG